MDRLHATHERVRGRSRITAGKDDIQPISKEDPTMNTATNRFSAVFVSFLAVLFMTLWSVPAAWANTASERDSAKAQCIASGDSWTEESDGSYSCESDTSTITCMGDELNLCIGCLSDSD